MPGPLCPWRTGIQPAPSCVISLSPLPHAAPSRCPFQTSSAFSGRCSSWNSARRPWATPSSLSCCRMPASAMSARSSSRTAVTRSCRPGVPRHPRRLRKGLLHRSRSRPLARRGRASARTSRCAWRRPGRRMCPGARQLHACWPLPRRATGRARAPGRRRAARSDCLLRAGRLQRHQRKRASAPTSHFALRKRGQPVSGSRRSRAGRPLRSTGPGSCQSRVWSASQASSEGTQCDRGHASEAVSATFGSGNLVS
mmetsp:Transcript_97777/g.276744  ORF Transcript_97777/g.276744 Transcript_97777/m.276744 type:complete len:254 (-) Transcript_97777:336-1097(-)